MEAHELRELGKQITREIAAGLMQATAAGAMEFAREMKAARDEAEMDGLLKAAEAIEQEKTSLRAQIAQASGLKRLALARRLAQVEEVERKMCAAVEGQPALPAIEHKPEDDTPTHRRNGRKFERVNGTNGAH